MVFTPSVSSNYFLYWFIQTTSANDKKRPAPTMKKISTDSVPHNLFIQHSVNTTDNVGHLPFPAQNPAAPSPPRHPPIFPAFGALIAASSDPSCPRRCRRHPARASPQPPNRRQRLARRRCRHHNGARRFAACPPGGYRSGLLPPHRVHHDVPWLTQQSAKKV